MRPRLALLAVLLAGLAWPAQAEWQLGGYLGGTATQNTSLAIRQPALRNQLRFDEVRFDGRSFEGPLYYGVRGGYFFSRHLGVEAEFIHAKVFADVTRLVPVSGTLDGAAIQGRVPLSAIVRRFSISHGFNLILANAVLRRDFRRADDQKLGRVILAARFGVGGSVSHPESNVLGAADEHYESGGAVLQLAAGAELRLWRGLYWLSEYKFTRTRQNLGIFAGDAQTLLRTHHGVFGFAYHF